MNEETRFARVEVTVTSADGRVMTWAADWPAKASPEPARLLVEVEADGRRPLAVAVRRATRAEDRARLPSMPDDEAVAFAAARLAEDKATAEGLLFACQDPGMEPDFWGCGGPAAESHWLRFSARRMLDEAVARLAIIGRQESDHAPVETDYGVTCRTCVDWLDDEGAHEFGIAIPQAWPCRVARSVLASWSGHPEYREEWKP